MLDKNSDFIEVIDEALSPELCKEIMQAFEACAHKSPGKTGGGVDPERKKSVDVSFSQLPEFAPLFQKVMQITGEHLLKYIEKYHFALIWTVQSVTLPAILMDMDKDTGTLHLFLLW